MHVREVAADEQSEVTLSRDIVNGELAITFDVAVAANYSIRLVPPFLADMQRMDGEVRIR